MVLIFFYVFMFYVFLVFLCFFISFFYTLRVFQLAKTSSEGAYSGTSLFSYLNS